MYKNIFRRRWIKSQEVIDYLLSIPKMYHVYFKLDCDGIAMPFPLRDENKNNELLTEFRERDVEGIYISYQDMGEDLLIHVNRQIDKYDLPHIRENVEKYMAKWNKKSKYDFSPKQLFDMQRKLRDQIESIVGFHVIDEEKYDDNTILLRLSNMTPEKRRRLLDYVCRLSDDAVPAFLQISLDGATVEQLDATATELDMFEMETNANMQINEENS